MPEPTPHPGPSAIPGDAPVVVPVLNSPNQAGQSMHANGTSSAPNSPNSRESSARRELWKRRLETFSTGVGLWRGQLEHLSGGAPEVLVSILLVTLISGFNDVAPKPVYWTAIAVVVLNAGARGQAGAATSLAKADDVAPKRVCWAAIAVVSLNAAIGSSLRPSIALLRKEKKDEDEAAAAGTLQLSQDPKLARNSKFLAWVSTEGLTPFAVLRLLATLILLAVCCWWPPKPVSANEMSIDFVVDNQAKASFIAVSVLMAFVELVLFSIAMALDVHAGEGGWANWSNNLLRNVWRGWDILVGDRQDVYSGAILGPEKGLQYMGRLVFGSVFYLLPCFGILIIPVVTYEAFWAGAVAALAVFCRLTGAVSTNQARGIIPSDSTNQGGTGIPKGILSSDSAANQGGPQDSGIAPGLTQDLSLTSPVSSSQNGIIIAGVPSASLGASTDITDSPPPSSSAGTGSSPQLPLTDSFAGNSLPQRHAPTSAMDPLAGNGSAGHTAAAPRDSPATNGVSQRPVAADPPAGNGSAGHTSSAITRDSSATNGVSQRHLAMDPSLGNGSLPEGSAAPGAVSTASTNRPAKQPLLMLKNAVGRVQKWVKPIQKVVAPIQNLFWGGDKLHWRLRIYNARYLSAVHAVLFGLVIGGNLGRVLSVDVYVLFYIMLLVDVVVNAAFYLYQVPRDPPPSDEEAAAFYSRVGWIRSAFMVPLAAAQLVLLTTSHNGVPMYLNSLTYESDGQQEASKTSGLLFTQVVVVMAQGLLPLETYLLAVPTLVTASALLFGATVVGCLLGLVACGVWFGLTLCKVVPRSPR